MTDIKRMNESVYSDGTDIQRVRKGSESQYSNTDMIRIDDIDGDYP